MADIHWRNSKIVSAMLRKWKLRAFYPQNVLHSFITAIDIHNIHVKNVI